MSTSKNSTASMCGVGLGRVPAFAASQLQDATADHVQDRTEQARRWLPGRLVAQPIAKKESGPVSILIEVVDLNTACASAWLSWTQNPGGETGNRGWWLSRDATMAKLTISLIPACTARLGASLTLLGHP